MANITQLAKTFNLTRQGIYKIDKQNNFNLSNIDDVKAEELLKDYIDNKNKNNNYIAKRLNMSIRKLKGITDRLNIIYADYETAEEIIEEVKKRLIEEKEEKQKNEIIKSNLKVYIKMYKYYSSMLNNNHREYMKITRRLENPKYIYSRERDKERLNFIDEQFYFLTNEREKMMKNINETYKGNAEVLKKELYEMAIAKGYVILDD